MQKYVCWEGGTGQWEMLIYGMISGNGCSKSWEGNDLREILFVYIGNEVVPLDSDLINIV